MRVWGLLVAGLAALAIPGSVGAAATPIAPAPGAVVTSAHPVFTWALPSNEESQAIYIANDPARTTEGRFFEENIMDAGAVTAETRQWSSVSPLYAGAYWWLVWTTDRDTFQSFYSAPSAFTVPASLRVTSIRAQRLTALNIAFIDVRWLANVKEPLVSARAYRGRRTIWAASRRQVAFVGTPGSTSFTFRSRLAREGTRLRLVATIRTVGATATRTVFFRAP